MRTPITYYGGKQKLVKELLPLIPKYQLYIEPFMGGGALFFAKEPSEAEIINDLNGNVTNFYRIVKTRFYELKQCIDGTLHSRATYYEALAIYNNPAGHDEVSRAWAFWVVTNQGFGGKIGSWALGRDGKTGKTLLHKKQNFTEDYAKRLGVAQIESKNALAIIKQYDSKDAFFYLDPPYFNSDCGHYKGYIEKDYRKLLDALVTIKGKFLLSSYPSEILQEYVKKYGWKCKEIRQRVSVNKNSNKQKTEVLVWNYEISPAESMVKPIPVAKKKRAKTSKIEVSPELIVAPCVQKSFEKSKRKRVENLPVRSKKSGVKRLHVAKSSGNFEKALQTINPERNLLTAETLKTFKGLENMNGKEAEEAVCTIHTLCRIIGEYMQEKDRTHSNPQNIAA